MDIGISSNKGYCIDNRNDYRCTSEDDCGFVTNSIDEMDDHLCSHRSGI